MDCTQARKKILAGDSSADSLRQHTAECPACAALLEDGGNLARRLVDGSPVEPEAAPPELLAEVEETLAKERGPVGRLRALSTTLRVTLALAAAAIVVSSGLLALRADFDVYPALRLGLELGSLVGIGLIAGWIWLRPLCRPALPGWLPVVAILVAAALPWALAAQPPAHLNHPASLAGTGGDLTRRAMACFLYGSLLGLPMALFVALLGRGARRLARLALLPAAAGALAGLVGLHLHCPLTSPVHLLAGHAPIVLSILLLAAGAYSLTRR